jgi:hypothetical protein
MDEEVLVAWRRFLRRGAIPSLSPLATPLMQLHPLPISP